MRNNAFILNELFDNCCVLVNKSVPTKQTGLSLFIQMIEGSGEFTNLRSVDR